MFISYIYLKQRHFGKIDKLIHYQYGIPWKIDMICDKV